MKNKSKKIIASTMVASTALSFIYPLTTYALVDRNLISINVDGNAQERSIVEYPESLGNLITEARAAGIEVTEETEDVASDFDTDAGYRAEEEKLRDLKTKFEANKAKIEDIKANAQVKDETAKIYIKGDINKYNTPSSSDHPDGEYLDSIEVVFDGEKDENILDKWYDLSSEEMKDRLVRGEGTTAIHSDAGASNGVHPDSYTNMKPGQYITVKRLGRTLTGREIDVRMTLKEVSSKNQFNGTFEQGGINISLAKTEAVLSTVTNERVPNISIHADFNASMPGVQPIMKDEGRSKEEPHYDRNLTLLFEFFDSATGDKIDLAQTTGVAHYGETERIKTEFTGGGKTVKGKPSSPATEDKNGFIGNPDYYWNSDKYNSIGTLTFGKGDMTYKLHVEHGNNSMTLFELFRANKAYTTQSSEKTITLKKYNKETAKKSIKVRVLDTKDNQESEKILENQLTGNTWTIVPTSEALERNGYKILSIENTQGVPNHVTNGTIDQNLEIVYKVHKKETKFIVKDSGEEAKPTVEEENAAAEAIPGFEYTGESTEEQNGDKIHYYYKLETEFLDKNTMREIKAKETGHLDNVEIDNYLFSETIEEISNGSKLKKHLYNKKTTKFVAINDMGNPVKPDEEGWSENQDAPEGYRYLTSEDNNDTAIRSIKFVKMHTEHRSENGDEVYPNEDGIKEFKEDNRDYKFVNYTEPTGEEDKRVVNYRKITTNFVSGPKDIPVSEAHEGFMDHKEIPNYRFVETVTADNGDITHKYEKLYTNNVDEEGRTPIGNPIEGIDGAPAEIPGYKFVSTEDGENGNRVNVYKKVYTKFLNVDDNSEIKEKVQLIQDDHDEIDGWFWLRTEMDGDNKVHIYKKIQTKFLNKDDNSEIAPTLDGTHDEREIENYFYIGMEEENGVRVHKYKKVYTYFKNEDGTQDVKPRVEGRSDDNEIEGYFLISREERDGDTTYKYHKIKTQFKNGEEEVSPEADGEAAPVENPNYFLTGTEVKENGDTIHNYRKINTMVFFDDETTPHSTEEGFVEHKDIDGYTFVNTNTDRNGDKHHMYVKNVTVYVNNTGKILKSVDGLHNDPEKIHGYKHVSTDNSIKGMIKHLVKAVHTEFVDEESNKIAEDEADIVDPKEIPNYKFLESRINGDDNQVHNYRTLYTLFVDEETNKDIKNKMKGIHPKSEDIENYFYNGMETLENGDIIHKYLKMITTNIDEETGDEITGKIKDNEYKLILEETKKNKTIKTYKKLHTIGINNDGENIYKDFGVIETPKEVEGMKVSKEELTDEGKVVTYINVFTIYADENGKELSDRAEGYKDPVEIKDMIVDKEEIVDNNKVITYRMLKTISIDVDGNELGVQDGIQETKEIDGYVIENEKIDEKGNKVITYKKKANVVKTGLTSTIGGAIAAIVGSVSAAAAAIINRKK